MLCIRSQYEWWTVLILLNLCIVKVNAQEIAFIQGLADQPAAQPLFGETVLIGGLLIDDVKALNDTVLAIQDAVPDALVDPTGNLVRDARLIVQNQSRIRQLEEKALLDAERILGRRSVGLVTWILTILACTSIVACGVLPAVLVRLDGDVFTNSTVGKRRLRYLLSFATGSLLGDVFLHLLPEVWSQHDANSCNIGLWILAGILCCFFIEKLCSATSASQKRACALMNLCTNIADNFTHGLAVGASFLICPKLGCFTTFAIVIHELPHEISDFAILLRGNFTLWTAIEAQLLTAVGGILGACYALYSHSTCINGLATSRLLSFTAGSFINIGLCQILPDLLREANSRESLLQLLLTLCGLFSMHMLNGFI